MTNSTTEKGASSAAAATDAKAAAEAVTDTFDRADFTRLQALVKAETTGVIYDAGKKRPLYSRTPEEAVTKRDQLVTAYEELLVRIEAIKKGQ